MQRLLNAIKSGLNVRDWLRFQVYIMFILGKSSFSLALLIFIVKLSILFLKFWKHGPLPVSIPLKLVFLANLLLPHVIAAQFQVAFKDAELFFLDLNFGANRVEQLLLLHHLDFVIPLQLLAQMLYILDGLYFWLNVEFLALERLDGSINF